MNDHKAFVPSLMRNTTSFCNNALLFVQARLSPMKSHSTIASGFSMDARPGTLPTVATPGFLNLVNPQELVELRDALMDGRVPRDLQLKLSGLAGGSLLHRFVEQNSRLIIALLTAAYGGSFREASHANLERLLRVLAYIRKEDDAHADCRPDGFVDDQQEIRAMLNEMGDLLQCFKMWHLRHQVPEMWRG
jgi:hypothetical protein